MLTWVCAAWWECCWGGWLRVSAPAACCVVYWRGVQYEWFLLLRIWFLTAANLSDLWQYSFTSVIPPFLTFISPMIHYLVCESHRRRRMWFGIAAELYVGEWCVVPRRGWRVVLLICGRYGGVGTNILVTGQQIMSTNDCFQWKKGVFFSGRL